MKMYKTVVYKGEEFLGEVEIYPQQQKHEESSNYGMGKKRVIDEMLLTKQEIRINHFSLPSERCPPLAVLHSITTSTAGISFKMESKNSLDTRSPLHLLHSSWDSGQIRQGPIFVGELPELKIWDVQAWKFLAELIETAVIGLGEEEVHLVAMHSRNNESQYPRFWAFNVASGLYASGLVMLNLRCLGIVFDLDETLIVANTMRSFEDRIEALTRKETTEPDPQRVLGILSEIKRYQDDKNILKQYVENDQVVENGRVIKNQSELVPALSNNHQPIVRPLIRLQEKNIILTRINPQIRDTSVLVRVRPAWEDLRNYLTARGRKRFEVYVCTMAERDYAFEMWRLLDPESNLINPKELLDRIVCVKSGSRKSLFNVFQDGTCNPKMSLVIDDRLKVWDEKDQPRVHVVPAFAPYYAPQAEANNTIPVLCVARNVACNVRGGFFKDFDEGLLQKIPEISFEDNTIDIPSPPDVSNYLASEDDASASSGNRDPLSSEGMADAEVERRVKEASSSSAITSAVNDLDPRIVQSLQYAMASSSAPGPLPMAQHSIVPFPSLQPSPVATIAKPPVQIGPSEPSLQSSPAREEGEIGESELDPDTRRRLLILQHGQDTRDLLSAESPFAVRASMQASVPPAQPQGSWVPVEEEMSPRQLNRGPGEFPLDSVPMNIEKHRPHQPSFFPKPDNAASSNRMIHENQRLPKEASYRDDRLRGNYSVPNCHSFSGEEAPLSRSSSSNRDFDFEPERAFSSAETPVEVLQDIAMKCGVKVEFRIALVASRDLQFSVEARFLGEKVGDGIGRTRREAQHQAAEFSIKKLSDMYMTRSKPDSGPMRGDTKKYSNINDNGFIGNFNSFGNQSFPKDESVSFSTTSEQSRVLDPRFEASRKLMSSVSALKEFCMTEGLGVNFLAQTPVASSSIQNDVHAQVEIDGQVLGKGIGSTWDEAKMQAAEKALGSLRTMFGQLAQKRQGSSPRAMHGMQNKRMKAEFQRGSARYAKNAPPVP